MRWLRWWPIAFTRPMAPTPRERLGSVLPLWPAYRVTQPAPTRKLELVKPDRERRRA